MASNSGTSTLGDAFQDGNRNALQTYIALAKNARSPAIAARVVSDALADKAVFAFAELWSQSSIQDLRQTDQLAWLNTLEIFMWSKWLDYQGATAKAELNEVQSLKLKQLTLLSLAAEPQKLSFDALRRELGCSDNISVSKVFTSAVAAGLLDGKIDGKSQTIKIDRIAPLRDLNPNERLSMNKTLKVWLTNAEAALKDVNESMADIHKTAAERRKREQAHDEVFENALNEGAKNSRKRGGGAGASERADAGVGSSGSRNTRQR